VLYVLLDLSARQARIARAGHLPALVVRPGEPAELVADRGSAPIGVTAAPIVDHTIDVPSGTTLLLYTDGLVEERSRPIDECLAGLREAVDSGRLAELRSEGLASLLVDRAPGSDDIALLIATIA
jgi:serine phosphatase RsbU (regulator of sigma subunit)